MHDYFVLLTFSIVFKELRYVHMVPFLASLAEKVGSLGAYYLVLLTNPRVNLLNLTSFHFSWGVRLPVCCGWGLLAVGGITFSNVFIMFIAGSGLLAFGGWAGFFWSSIINTCMKKIEGEPMAQIIWSYYLRDADEFRWVLRWTHGSN